MRPINETTARVLLSATIAAGVVALGLTTANAIAVIGHLSPAIGDIVAFTPGTAQPLADVTRLLVHRRDRFGCILDLDVLGRSGGSLVVESEVTGLAGSFRVHWAGQRTSPGAADCGSDADLILDRRELDVLALSAGGYGFGQDHAPVRVSPYEY